MVEVPFSKRALVLAVSELEDLGEDKLKEKVLQLHSIGVELLPVDRALMNSKIAKWQGITVEVLVNSLNYAVLCMQYNDYGVKTWAERAQKELGLTECQAWAMIAAVKGMLD